MDDKAHLTLELLRKTLAAGVTTQRALAPEAGIPQSTLSKMLNGREYLGERRAERIRAAIVRLTVDRDQASAPEADGVEPQLRRL